MEHVLGAPNGAERMPVSACDGCAKDRHPAPASDHRIPSACLDQPIRATFSLSLEPTGTVLDALLHHLG